MWTNIETSIVNRFMWLSIFADCNESRYKEGGIYLRWYYAKPITITRLAHVSGYFDAFLIEFHYSEVFVELSLPLRERGRKNGTHFRIVERLYFSTSYFHISAAVMKQVIVFHTFFHRHRSRVSIQCKIIFSKRIVQRVKTKICHHSIRPNRLLLECHEIDASNMPATYHSVSPIQYPRKHNFKHLKCSNSNSLPTNNSTWLKSIWIDNRFGCVAHWRMKRKFHVKNWKSFCHRWRTILRRDHGVWCGFDLVTIHVKISPADTTKRLTIESDRTRSRKRWVNHCEFFSPYFTQTKIINFFSVNARLRATERQKAIWKTRTRTSKLIVCPKLVNHSTE